MAKKTIDEHNDFDLVNLPIEAQDPEITADDFKRVTVDKSHHEQRFQTKPTTFFKDSMKRFVKNKSSVVASVILGMLLVMAFVVPAVENNVVDTMTSYSDYLEPKLFDSGTGWWDGTKKYTEVPATYDKEGKLIPDPTSFKQNAIIGEVKDDGVKYRNTANKYAEGGYVRLMANYNNVSGDYGYLRTNEFLYFVTKGSIKYVDTEQKVMYDLDDGSFDIKFTIGNNDFPTEKYPDNVYTNFDFIFSYEKCVSKTDNKYEQDTVVIQKDISKDSTEITISDVSSILKTVTSEEGNLIRNPRFGFGIKTPKEGEEFCLLVKSLEFVFSYGDLTNANLQSSLNAASFTDANACCLRDNEVYLDIDEYGTQKKFVNPTGFSSNSSFSLFHAKYHACSFTYDTYEAKLGLQTNFVLGVETLEKYVNAKYIYADLDSVSASTKRLEIEILDRTHCPIVESEDGTYPVQNYDKTYGTYEIVCDIQLYKYHGYTEMPRYLFGTDVSGHNMNKYVFEGLRNSLLLGIITSAICFIFGLIWGAICGYFGGATDLIMERFTDILSGVPWIVVMTLCIIKLGQSMLVFGLALCLTGWIGTAATTRTQFYRFKNREYVLASRTLGASDARLIAKHILPNAMGTIITRAVLMIPSVIFSEATISYLGLGLKGMSSLGVILSDNQKEILTHPYLLLFPSIIIALIMISFNLFGNGLRDAINPSLKGED